jgi:hypothetical protein
MPETLSVSQPTGAAEPSKAERERLAFRQLLPQLLSQSEYVGQFVAIHNGEVIDHDANDIELVQRVHARVGYVPIHVARVTESTAPERVPHYREYRGPTSK